MISGPPSEILGCSKHYQFTDEDSTVNFPFHSFKFLAWYGKPLKTLLIMSTTWLATAGL